MQSPTLRIRVMLLLALIPRPAGAEPLPALTDSDFFRYQMDGQRLVQFSSDRHISGVDSSTDDFCRNNTDTSRELTAQLPTSVATTPTHLGS
jgi:hypothetical protein